MGSSREKKVTTDKVIKHNVRYRFRGSGRLIKSSCASSANREVISEHATSVFAACFLNEGVQGCLPKWVLNVPTFICLKCYELESLPPPVCEIILN